MSDDTVFKEKRDVCNLYPNFINSDGTIEWNLINLEQSTLCCSHTNNYLSNINGYMSEILEKLDVSFKEITELLIEIRDNTSRIP